MPVTPTSGMAIAMHALRRLVASSAAFRTEVSAANEAAALASIYLFETNDTPSGSALTNARPRAIINLPAYSIDKEISESPRENIVMALAFEFVPSALIIAGGMIDEATWMANTLGTVLEQMLANSGGANGSGEACSNVVEFVLEQSPAPNAKDHDPVNQYFWGANLRVTAK